MQIEHGPIPGPAAAANRLTAFAGVATFLLVAIGFLVAPVWDAPESTSTVDQLNAYIRAHRGALLASLLLYSVAMGLFLCFAGGLREFLRVSRSKRARHAFGYGAVALTALVLAGFAPLNVLAYRVPDRVVIQPLYDLSFGLLALSGIPTVIFMLAYAVMVADDRVLPIWTAWLAVAGAIAHVAVAAPFLASSGFVSLEGGIIVVAPFTFFLWVLGTSVGLLMTPARNAR